MSLTPVHFTRPSVFNFDQPSGAIRWTHLDVMRSQCEIVKPSSAGRPRAIVVKVASVIAMALFNRRVFRAWNDVHG